MTSTRIGWTLIAVLAGTLATSGVVWHALKRSPATPSPRTSTAASPSAPSPVATPGPSSVVTERKTEPPLSPLWEPVEDLSTLPGVWVSAEHGDAIPNGPTGGVEVLGAARVVFIRGKPSSRTPWNFSFWIPKSGSTDSNKIAGGCGFYPGLVDGRRDAFCRGYGLPDGSHPVRLDIMKRTASASIRVRIDELLDEELVKK